MSLLVINQTSHRAPRTFLKGLHAQMVKKLPKKHARDLKGELVVVLVDKKQGQKLNWQFRKKNYATDVLSFASLDPSSLGELVICLPVIRRQASEHGLTFRQELAYMLIHGVLHLLGYEHETSDTDARKMFRLQDRLFEDLFYPLKLDKP